MASRIAADRYARALLDVSIKETDPEQVGREIEAFGSLMNQHETLRHALVSPAVPVTAKRRVMTELTARAGLLPLVQKLLMLLADRDRLALLPEIVEAYRTRLMDHQQIVRAEITTAVPLPADRAQALELTLAELTGKRVTVSTRLDPSIIGGVVARVGSLVYDGSVTRQLERMKEKLTEEA